MDDLSSGRGPWAEPDGTTTPPPPPPPPPPMAGAHTYIAGQPVPEVPSGVGTAATVAQVAIGFVGFVSVASLILNVVYAGELDSYADGGSTIGRIEDLETQLGAIAGLYLLGMLVAGVVHLVWQAKVRRAAEALGAVGFRHGRRMAVGWWFVPFANLVVPKKVTNDLWRATAENRPRRFDIAGEPVAAIVNWWFACWLAGNIFNRGVGSPDTLEDIASSSRIEAFGDALTVVAAVLAIVMIRRLTSRLRARGAAQGLPVW